MMFVLLRENITGGGKHYEAQEDFASEQRLADVIKLRHPFVHPTDIVGHDSAIVDESAALSYQI